MDATYDRELIAEMLAAAAHGGIHLFAMDAVMGQIAALRAADNRDAAGVDADEDAYVIEHMGKLLAEIAVIVNGPEPALTRWSYHDLPDKVRALKEAPTAAPAGEAVAYLDIGVGGYLDLGTEKDDDELFKLPPGRHMLGIIGTYGVDGYKANPPAAEAPAPVQAAPQPAGGEAVAFAAQVKEARRVWIEENPCEDGRDHVTPFDRFLYTTPPAPVQAAPQEGGGGLLGGFNWRTRP